MTAATTTHGITVAQIQLPAGRPFQVTCGCGWTSGIIPSRPKAHAAGIEHLRHVAIAEAATTEQIEAELARRGMAR